MSTSIPPFRPRKPDTVAASTKIEKLGISSDEECERMRKRIEEHPEWADNILDEPPDYLPDDLRE